MFQDFALVVAQLGGHGWGEVSKEKLILAVKKLLSKELIFLTRLTFMV